MLITKHIALVQLAAELSTAGEPVPNGLAISGPSQDDPSIDLHTFDDLGRAVDLQPSAAAVVAAHVPKPDAEVEQRITDAAELLNAPAVRDTQRHRDAFARLIGVKPLAIPLGQDATPADIQPL